MPLTKGLVHPSGEEKRQHKSVWLQVQLLLRGYEMSRLLHISRSIQLCSARLRVRAAPLGSAAPARGKRARRKLLCQAEATPSQQIGVFEVNENTDEKVNKTLRLDDSPKRHGASRLLYGHTRGTGCQSCSGPAVWSQPLLAQALELCRVRVCIRLGAPCSPPSPSRGLDRSKGRPEHPAVPSQDPRHSVEALSLRGSSANSQR